MASTANTHGLSADKIVETYEHEGERLQDVVDVKSDITFTSIFANLIRKMDDAAQAAV
jgi:hypothetical protein